MDQVNDHRIFDLILDPKLKRLAKSLDEEDQIGILFAWAVIMGLSEENLCNVLSRIKISDGIDLVLASISHPGDLVLIAYYDEHYLDEPKHPIVDFTTPVRMHPIFKTQHQTRSRLDIYERIRDQLLTDALKP